MIPTTTYQQSSLRSNNEVYRYFFNGQESDGEAVAFSCIANE